MGPAGTGAEGPATTMGFWPAIVPDGRDWHVPVSRVPGRCVGHTGSRQCRRARSEASDACHASGLTYRHFTAFTQPAPGASRRRAAEGAGGWSRALLEIMLLGLGRLLWFRFRLRLWFRFRFRRRRWLRLRLRLSVCCVARARPPGGGSPSGHSPAKTTGGTVVASGQ